MAEQTPAPGYADLRVTYNQEVLEISDLQPSPLAQFESWFHEALAAEIPEPNAMVVATVSATGQPSARHVLLKAADQRGFVFYTNYQSRKGREIAENPQVSLVFPWFAMFRQVVVIGRAERVSRAESLEYFRSRPHDSQIGAIASRQSSLLPERIELEQRWADLAERYPEGSEVPLPDDWGGYVVAPESVEFWAGRRSRLHDRLRYCHLGGPVDMSAASQWQIERLSP